MSKFAKTSCRKAIRRAILLLLVVLQQSAIGQFAAAEQKETSSVAGKVIFKGDPLKHPRLVIETGGDEFCSKIADLKTESVTLNSTKPPTIKNVVVWVADMPASRPERMIEAVMIQMKDCRFVPHVLAMHNKQQLNIKNSDDTAHDVHLLPRVGAEHNVLMQQMNMQMMFRIKPEPAPFPIQSDTKPWMSGWIACFDHPFYAVTGDDGTFKISDVPSGKHTLKAWHEVFGTLMAEVELKPGESKEIDFTFDPEKPESRSERRSKTLRP